jgi:diguanylate cyclase (GGDEF)-like protein
MGKVLSEAERQERYSRMSKTLVQLPAEELEKRIKDLTLHLLKISEDFDRRITLFVYHRDALFDLVGHAGATFAEKKAIGLAGEMLLDFKKGRIKAFEKKKVQVTKKVVTLRKEIPNLIAAVSVIHKEEAIFLQLEKAIEVDAEILKQRTTELYEELKHDADNFIEFARKKLAQKTVVRGDFSKALGVVMTAEKEQEALLQEEAHLIVITKELVRLIATLDPVLISLNDTIQREVGQLAHLIVPKGQRPDADVVTAAMNYLRQVADEIMQQLRAEKILVHDKFLQYIDMQNDAALKAGELGAVKRGFFDRLRGRRRITMDEVKVMLGLFTDDEERAEFLGGVASLVEHAGKRYVADEVTVEELTKLRKAVKKGRKEQEQRLIEAANKDGLTKLYNRRFFDEKMLELVMAKIPFSMLIIDIDHFKKFNDVHGHQIGDLVLREVARLLEKGTRAKEGKDFVCRYGGEEKCVIFPNTKVEDAKKVSDRLLESVRKHPVKDLKGKPLKWPDGRDVQITFSGGVIGVVRQDYPKGDFETGKAEEMAEAIVATADHLLYNAKDSGRNKVNWGYYSEDHAHMLMAKATKEMLERKAAKAQQAG